MKHEIVGHLFAHFVIFKNDSILPRNFSCIGFHGLMLFTNSLNLTEAHLSLHRFFPQTNSMKYEVFKTMQISY
jgi:hypothetical protein